MMGGKVIIPSKNWQLSHLYALGVNFLLVSAAP
jgi:hypothetical protein